MTRTATKRKITHLAQEENGHQAADPSLTTASPGQPFAANITLRGVDWPG